MEYEGRTISKNCLIDLLYFYKKHTDEKVEVKFYFNLALATYRCLCVIRLPLSSAVRHIEYKRFYHLPWKQLPEFMGLLAIMLNSTKCLARPLLPLDFKSCSLGSLRKDDVDDSENVI